MCITLLSSGKYKSLLTPVSLLLEADLKGCFKRRSENHSALFWSCWEQGTTPIIHSQNQGVMC